MIYPWQKSLWSRMQSERGRLPHAILLRGQMGIGKLDFAVELANSLLCLRPSDDGFACNGCESCHWFSQANHPDFRLLSPDSGDQDDSDTNTKKKTKKANILIEQVRSLNQFLTLSSHRASAMRVLLIAPAETLNEVSANALLKILEEPPPGLMFILVCHEPQRLLPTILSRCHQIAMPLPSREEAIVWLSEHSQLPIQELAVSIDYMGGSPIKTLQKTEQNSVIPHRVIEELSKGADCDYILLAGLLNATKQDDVGMTEALNIFQKWCYDLASYLLTDKVYYHSEMGHLMRSLANKCVLNSLLDFEKAIIQSKRHATHPLMTDLQLESLALQYTKLFLAN